MWLPTGSPRRVSRREDEGTGRGAAVSKDLTRLSDAQLLRAVGRLEVDALGELYRRHGAGVFVLAHQLLGPARAEEATQDIFLYVWDHPDELLGMAGGLRSVLLDQLRIRHLSFVEPAENRRLTDDERAALELAVEGLGYREAAIRLGRPSAEVDSLLRSALHKVYETRVAPSDESRETRVAPTDESSGPP